MRRVVSPVRLAFNLRVTTASPPGSAQVCPELWASVCWLTTGHVSEINIDLRKPSPFI